MKDAPTPIFARCYSLGCGGTWHRNPGKAHEFTAVEAGRLLEWMSEEDWEDGPRCLRKVLDDEIAGELG